MKTGAALSSVLALAPFVLLTASIPAQTPAAAATQQPAVESYYKIAPGRTDEWLERYRTQHLPILQEMQREGRILSITIYRPFLHQGGPPWDFKVILRFRDFTALGDREHEEAVERRLFPDWEAHRQDERRRWAITDKHWDDIMTEVPAE